MQATRIGLVFGGRAPPTQLLRRGQAQESMADDEAVLSRLCAVGCHEIARTMSNAVAAEEALSFSAGMTLEKFEADPETVFATIRALEVVGEAAGNLPDSYRTEHASAPWGDMAAVRDVLIHDYFLVDLEIVW